MKEQHKRHFLVEINVLLWKKLSCRFWHAQLQLVGIWTMRKVVFCMLYCWKRPILFEHIMSFRCLICCSVSSVSFKGGNLHESQVHVVLASLTEETTFNPNRGLLWEFKNHILLFSINQSLTGLFWRLGLFQIYSCSLISWSNARFTVYMT